MKIKIISIISALALMLSLSACGSKQPSGTVKPNESSQPDISGSVSPDDNGGDNEFSLGSTNGGTYENSFIGISCSLDSSWTYYTDEQISELNGITADNIEDEDLAEQLKNSSAFYDMMASADDGILSINVVFENLGVLYGMTLDEESYVDTALGTLENTLTASGYSNVSCQKATFDFCGETRYGTSIYAEISGVAVYEKQVCIKSGNYMAVVTLVSVGEDATDSLLELFSAL